MHETSYNRQNSLIIGNLGTLGIIGIQQVTGKIRLLG